MVYILVRLLHGRPHDGQKVELYTLVRKIELMELQFRLMQFR